MASPVKKNMKLDPKLEQKVSQSQNVVEETEAEEIPMPKVDESAFDIDNIEDSLEKQAQEQEAEEKERESMNKLKKYLLKRKSK